MRNIGLKTIGIISLCFILLSSACQQDTPDPTPEPENLGYSDVTNGITLSNTHIALNNLATGTDINLTSGYHTFRKDADANGDIFTSVGFQRDSYSAGNLIIIKHNDAQVLSTYKQKYYPLKANLVQVGKFRYKNASNEIIELPVFDLVSAQPLKRKIRYYADGVADPNLRFLKVDFNNDGNLERFLIQPTCTYSDCPESVSIPAYTPNFSNITIPSAITTSYYKEGYAVTSVIEDINDNNTLKLIVFDITRY